jgi:hypothetical protein
MAKGSPAPLFPAFVTVGLATNHLSAALSDQSKFDDSVVSDSNDQEEDDDEDSLADCLRGSAYDAQCVSDSDLISHSDHEEEDADFEDDDVAECPRGSVSEAKRTGADDFDSSAFGVHNGCPTVLVRGVHYDDIQHHNWTRPKSGNPTLFGQVALVNNFRLSRAFVKALCGWIRSPYFNPRHVREFNQCRSLRQQLFPLMPMFIKNVPVSTKYLKKVKKRGFVGNSLLKQFPYGSMLRTLLSKLNLKAGHAIVGSELKLKVVTCRAAVCSSARRMDI